MSTTDRDILFSDYYKQWITTYKQGAIRAVTMSKYTMALQWVKKRNPKTFQPLSFLSCRKWGARGPGDLGFAPTEAERRPHEVRGTSVLRRPKRSEDLGPAGSRGSSRQ